MYVSGSIFCIRFSRLEEPEQTLGGSIPLGLGMVMKINLLNFHVIIEKGCGTFWHTLTMYM